MALSAALDIGIKGSAAQKHVLGQIMVHAVHHTISTPRDPKTGMPSGDPQHGALTITKNVDLSSPELRAAMLSGRLIGKGKLSFYRLPPAGGIEETHYSIIITGARIVSIGLLSPNINIPSESLGQGHAARGAKGTARLHQQHSQDADRLADPGNQGRQWRGAPGPPGPLMEGFPGVAQFSPHQPRRIFPWHSTHF